MTVMEIEIQIIKEKDSISRYAFYNGYLELFQFEPRGIDDIPGGKGKWYFWPRGGFDPEIFTGAFPMKYFQDLCKAMVFIRGKLQELPDGIKITKGIGFTKNI